MKKSTSLQKKFNNLLLSFFNYFVFLQPLFVPKSGRAEGGQQTYIKGVESTFYLRLTESRKFTASAR